MQYAGEAVRDIQEDGTGTKERMVYDLRHPHLRPRHPHPIETVRAVLAATKVIYLSLG